MKYKISVTVLVLLFMVVIVYHYLYFNSFINQMKFEYIPKTISGKVCDVMLIKGGSLVTMIHTPSGDDGISVRNTDSVLRNIKKWTYFKKLPNSNQCYIIKGDSVMYFNCFVFSILLRWVPLRVGIKASPTGGVEA